jgi:putative redox protein
MGKNTTASAQWTDHERFTAAASSNHAMMVDSGDTKSANGPMELVLIALCSCTATDVVSILRKKREPFTSVVVEAEGVRPDEPPRIFTHIKLKYKIGGKVSRKAVEDAVRLSEEKYCSVSQMLQKSSKVEYSIELLDEK